MIQEETRQLKLANGEEILCEVVQWAEGEDFEILVRRAMRLIMMENGEGMKYYAFRPWMVYQQSGDDLLIINSSHIVGMGFPTRTLLVQYHEAVADMREMHVQREQEFEQEFGEPKRMRKSVDKIEDYLSRMDSGSNVIDMMSHLSKDTVH